MKIKIYNSAGSLVFEGDEIEFAEMRTNHLVNGSDRIVIQDDEQKPAPKRLSSLSDEELKAFHAQRKADGDEWIK